jgi:sodium/proline symporter
VIGAVVVFLYTLLGGFLGESFTDLVQGILMIAAIILVFVMGIPNAGGLSGISENLKTIPRFFEIFGTATPGGGPGANYSFMSILSCLAWGLGYFGMPQVLIRFMAIKNPAELNKARIIACTWCVISLFAAVGIGLIGRALVINGSLDPALFVEGKNAELIFLEMARKFFPPVLAGLVLSGILGAAMSSADSYMLITSSSLANDLLKNSINKNLSDKQVLWIARATMLLVTLFGLYVALIPGNDSIFNIVSYAWAGLGACFGPLILFSLFWKRTTLAGAAAGMLAGGIIVVLWKNIISALTPALNVYELLPAFIISSAVIVVVSLATPAPSAEIQEEFEKAKLLSGAK